MPRLSGGAQRLAQLAGQLLPPAFLVRAHRVSSSMRASASRPRAAVDFTVPGLMPSVLAISASDR